MRSEKKMARNVPREKKQHKWRLRKESLGHWPAGGWEVQATAQAADGGGAEQVRRVHAACGEQARAR